MTPVVHQDVSIPVAAAIGLLQDCVEALQYWFQNNILLLNPSKPTIVYFGTHGRLRQSVLPSQITAADCSKCFRQIVSAGSYTGQHTLIQPACE